MNPRNLFRLSLEVVFILLMLSSCKKLRQIKQPPELEPVQQGLRASAAIAYCASVAVSAFEGKPLPSNVIFNKNGGLIYIKIDDSNPLPFNSNIGDIVVAGLWQQNEGVISILFANIDILAGQFKLYGLQTVPVIESTTGQGILTLFAKEDIIIGEGSDTILDLSNISASVFNSEIDRLNTTAPSDAFVAVKQNVWFINIDQGNTSSNVYDDDIKINGGGQIAEINGATGGVMYHAMINTEVNYSVCSANPISGNALSQNFKAGGVTLIDLGNSFLSFHNKCDGMVHVDIATGKYFSYTGKDIPLGF